MNDEQATGIATNAIDYQVTQITERDERIRQLERINAALAAEIDTRRVYEHALSDAYLRLRRLIGRRAFDTPHGPTGEQVWATTETALRELVVEIGRMRPVVEAALKWNRTNHRDTREIEITLDAIGEACDTYEAAKQRDDSQHVADTQGPPTPMGRVGGIPIMKINDGKRR